MKERKVTRREFLRGAAGALLAESLKPKKPAETNFLVSQLKLVLPEEPEDLTLWQEWEIARIVEKATGIPVRVSLKVRPDNYPEESLEGEEARERRLNAIYGRIGREQHLRRFPEDRLAYHKRFLDAGIAPQLSAWQYFAKSKKEFDKNPKLEKREEYYLTAQYMYTPEWESLEEKGDMKTIEELWLWWKYRKMLLVNPENGQAVVAIVGDGGPARWTGKQFGGSPEVMAALGLASLGVGETIALLVNDPEGKIPLGPVNFFPFFDPV